MVEFVTVFFYYLIHQFSHGKLGFILIIQSHDNSRYDGNIISILLLLNLFLVIHMAWILCISICIVISDVGSNSHKTVRGAVKKKSHKLWKKSIIFLAFFEFGKKLIFDDPLDRNWEKFEM